ncbi:Sphingosine kinase 1 [Lobosporangium transversale]|uniref:ATP-NAD kinase-like domain-containing protein n=1 Tax=Lobosporangium transversale TaxID=64571 RepID=A0A1Y2GTN6_9FUNG|nr:ATP-NAD kinase-like domain-containing protein [Lobosporangium transversale]KAF9899594.1 Sphingosine kinase 1 [Lobosporangium transversale]ORZ21055.1 ATP-NAD kinase-like domain-containing protein [Lobosporangium transversale]|eukprot:XP_021882964.1 ATP-NAD kinase-like domain-containing protein [Lobosporangium transversale]
MIDISPTENVFTCSASFKDPSTLYPTTLELSSHQLLWSARHPTKDNHTIQVPYCCIYGYEAPTPAGLDVNHQDLKDIVQNTCRDRMIKVHFVEFLFSDLKAVSSPQCTTAYFLFERRADVQRFLNLAHQLGVFPRPRRILALVNPNGGVGKAKTINDTVVQPMLEHSGLDVKVQYTEYSKHGIDVAHKIDLKEVDTLAVVSGDGLLHEIVNGLLSRSDWDHARRLPIAIIPAGSGNATATSIGIRSPIVATLALIRGDTVKLDIFSLSQLDRPRIYSMLMFSWGMMADADIESDIYRWLGPLRFEIAGFIRLIRLRRYPGKVYFLPPHHKAKPSPASTLDSSRNSSHKQDAPVVQYGHLLKDIHHKPPEPWSLLPNMPFYTMLLLLNFPSAGETIYFTDSIRFNDGVMKLWYSCETRFWKIILPFVLDLTNGKLVERDLMQNKDCGGLLIIPGVEGKPNDKTTHEVVDHEQVRSESAKKLGIYQKPGIFDVDGEVMPTARTLIEVLPSFMDITIPEWFYHEKDVDRERTALAKLKTELIKEASKRQHPQQRTDGHNQVREVFLVLFTLVTVVTAYALFFNEEHRARERMAQQI